MLYLHPLQYEDLIKNELLQDLGIGGDISSALTVLPGEICTAALVARKEGCISGIAPALFAFRLAGADIAISPQLQDGKMVAAGDVIAELRGPVREILTAERTALNILSHLSGIATQTAAMVAAIEDTGAKICDTRKTLPGLRALQKYAVRCGGGVNHRYGLDGAVMLKDNHLKALGGDPGKTISGIRKHIGPTVKIELEVDTLEQVETALLLPIDIILLDNMDVSILKEAVSMIAGKYVTEASGNIGPDNVRDVALTGVNFISSGALTHSSASLDIGLDIT